MAYYLVTARVSPGVLPELEERLGSGEILAMRPFGRALDESLRGARVVADDPERLTVAWEENDYCTPPLAMERAALLDDYFSDLEVEEVARGEGWARIDALPGLWTR